jgi:phospholipid/cholesterol/gamma-HCH transport system substrate-binding protein
MLTRFVRNQLIIFTIASIIGVAVMIFGYMQVPTLLGWGRITVKMELPSSGGLYQFSNVTYRGVNVGKVTDVKVVDGKHVEATLSLETSPKIPAGLEARVLSISAVGEQYVDLQPHDDSPPYLQNGSVIAMADTSVPQQVGPMLDRLGSLVDSIPQEKLTALLDESFKAFNGAGYDFGSLLDSSSKLTSDFNGVADQSRALIDDSGPLLDSQVQSVDAIHTWARSLAGITEQLKQNDPQVRTLLTTGPGALDEVSRLLTDAKPTLPVLLANLTTLGQVFVTYNSSLEQLMVLLPPYIAATRAVAPANNPTGIAQGDFSITIGDPPACTVGFLPPSSWRSPADETEIDTPDGLYCKLPQDSPIAVRGARNYPCMGHPGKRAPTVQLCDDPKGYTPLAQRQHTLGVSPLDPNLISQGIPPDARANPADGLYGPLEGTPLPPGVLPPGGLAPSPAQPASPVIADAAVAPPADAAVPPPADPGLPTAAPPDLLPATPSAFGSNSSGPAPVATAQYNPETGAYMGHDGKMYRQSDLVTSTASKTWKDLVLDARDVA